jgi:hypothetical protein
VTLVAVLNPASLEALAAEENADRQR